FNSAHTVEPNVVFQPVVVRRCVARWAGYCSRVPGVTVASAVYVIQGHRVACVVANPIPIVWTCVTGNVVMSIPNGEARTNGIGTSGIPEADVLSRTIDCWIARWSQHANSAGITNRLVLIQYL